MKIIKEENSNLKTYIIYSNDADPNGRKYLVKDPTLSYYDARNAYRFKMTPGDIKKHVALVNSKFYGHWAYMEVKG